MCCADHADVAAVRSPRGWRHVVRHAIATADNLVLFLYIDFIDKKRNIKGFIALLMDLPSITTLKTIVHDYIETLTDEHASGMLKMSGFEWKSVLDAVEVGIIVLDEDFTVRGWNDWIARTSGLPQSSTCSARISSIYFPPWLRTRVPLRDHGCVSVRQLQHSDTFAEHIVAACAAIDGQQSCKTSLSGRSQSRDCDLLPDPDQRRNHRGDPRAGSARAAERALSRHRRFRARSHHHHHRRIGPSSGSNTAAERVFGYAPSELLGQKIDILLVQPEMAHDGFMSSGEAKANLFLQMVGRRKDGAVRQFRHFVRPLDGGRSRLRHDDLARCHRTNGGRGGAPRKRDPSPRACWRRCRNWCGHATGTGSATTSIRNGRRTRARPAEEHLDWGWLNVIHEEERDRWQRGLDSRSLANGDVFDIDARLRRYDGTTAGSRCARSRSRTTTATITRWFGTATDITDLVEARETLHRSNEELETLVDERTKEREVALRQLHESQKMETSVS